MNADLKGGFTRFTDFLGIQNDSRRFIQKKLDEKKIHNKTIEQINISNLPSDNIQKDNIVIFDLKTYNQRFNRFGTYALKNKGKLRK